MDEESPIRSMIAGIISTYSEGLDAGVEHASRKLLAIHTAYDMALKDPNVKMPSYLHAAIEASRMPLKRVPSVPGRPDHDLDVFCRPLKAGT